MNDKNENRLNDFSSANVLRLGELLRSEVENQWQIGDLLIEMTGQGWKVKDLAEHFGRPPNQLSEYKRAAKDFPENERDYSVPFTHFLIARRVVGKELSSNINQARLTITRLGLGQSRDALGYFGQQRANRENRDNILVAAKRLTGGKGDLIGKCHHDQFQTILEQLEDGLVTLLHADPPFGNFIKTKSGKFDTSTCACRTDCDNADNEKSLQVTLDLLRLAPSKIAKGGVLLLWQSSKLMRPEVLTSIADNGWEAASPEVWWDKNKPKLEEGEGLYGSQSERLFVLKRAGDSVRNCAPELSRGNILRFDPVQMRAELAHEHHSFEKPLDLCRYLVRKHSYSGDLIVDAFGCSGSFCIAAAELGRRWIYCESNRENFVFGNQKIAAAQLASEKLSA